MRLSLEDLFSIDFEIVSENDSGIREKSYPGASHDASIHINGKQFKKTSTAKSTDNVTPRNLIELWERQHRRCALTGIPIDDDTCSLDHIIPCCDGGEHVMSNVHLVHKVVNRMKSTMGLGEFIKWCSLVAENAKAEKSSQNTD